MPPVTSTGHPNSQSKGAFPRRIFFPLCTNVASGEQCRVSPVLLRTCGASPSKSHLSLSLLLPPGCPPQMQPGFSGAGSATAPRCPRRISPSGNTLVWFSSIIFSFFYSALWPFSGLKYIHRFSIFLALELMTVSLLTEPWPHVLTPGRVWWDAEESQLQLPRAPGCS